MKTRLFLLSFGLAFGLYGQTAPTTPSTPVPPSQPSQPAPAQPGTSQAGAQGTTRPQVLAGATNQLRFGGGTNLFSRTNQFAFTNAFIGTNLPPTGRTNGVILTNMFDRAFTAQDQSLLVTIRQRIDTAVTLSPYAPAVHLVVRDGIVTVMGTIPGQQERTSLISMIQGIPGVVRVLDRMRIGTGAAIGVTEGIVATDADRALFVRIRQTIETEITISAQAAVATAAPAAQPAVQVSVQSGAVTLNGTVASEQQKTQIATTVQRISGVTRVNNQLRIGVSGQGGITNTFGGSVTGGVRSSFASTNLPPTGRTNPLQGLPPGLEKRETLPPGLQRETLPPGLEKRTNNSGFPPSANP